MEKLHFYFPLFLHFYIDIYISDKYIFDLFIEQVSHRHTKTLFFVFRCIYLMGIFPIPQNEKLCFSISTT